MGAAADESLPRLRGRGPVKKAAIDDCHAAERGDDDPAKEESLQAAGRFWAHGRGIQGNGKDATVTSALAFRSQRALRIRPRGGCHEESGRERVWRVWRVWRCKWVAGFRYAGRLVKIVRSAARAARLFTRGAHGPGHPLVLAPTMGALHAGHVSLMHRARKLAGKAGTVAVSIYVNPAQFGPREDFSRYPRTFASDCRLCREAGVDIIFHPDEMYPPGYSTYVNEERVSQVLCGKSRPGHFRGVCTVVLKLFNIVRPDIAVFGEKDYQQVAVIRQMVRDLDVPVRIVASPTVREADGLALSSRNAYLTAAERAQAPVIRRALLAARDHRSARPADLARLVAREIATAPLAKIDYIDVLDSATLETPGAGTRELVIACAVHFGKTRLIDNIRRENSKFEIRNSKREKPA